MPLFSMSGDGHTDINIPVVFLFGVEAQRLMDALRQHGDLSVYIGEAAKKPSNYNILSLLYPTAVMTHVSSPF